MTDKYKLKDLKCKDIDCSECPFDTNCGWVLKPSLTFGENLKNFVKELEVELEMEVEVE